MNAPLVFIIILNFNKPDDTIECIESINSINYENYHVVIIDNGSSDNSVNLIKERFPKVELIETEKNLGYTEGNNYGIREALKANTDYILILNNDTIVDPEMLPDLITVMEQDPLIAVAGPLVYHANEPTVIQCAGVLYEDNLRPKILNQNQEETGLLGEPFEVDSLSGSGMIVRCDAIRHVGLLDPAFFCYWEENDWCDRFKESGYKIYSVPKAKMWHKGVNRSYAPSPNVTYYMTRNRLLLLKKRRANLKTWISEFYELFRVILSWTIQPKWKHMLKHRDATIQGIFDYAISRFGER